jgi:AcrR family transcriptional regulator
MSRFGDTLRCVNARRYVLKARAEKQGETRRRIIAAATELCTTHGPLAMAISEVAARAGVGRVTLYRHFPAINDLRRAAARELLREHPLPDMSRSEELGDPIQMARRILLDLYAHYAEVAPAARLVLRDAEIDPTVLVLDPKAMFAPLESSLLRAFPSRVRSRAPLRAAVRHAMDFRTWDSIRRGSGLTDAATATLMTSLIAAAANLPSNRR